ncbi:bifunctional hydroxymethylpyrimidine kinase/phosphomethylpyrimidine kinase [Simiduia sp. 21SJ11W-1]|uniref:bifunctional hydroxymethylpyrimidine kinase/phosphomethylpyrimidine kinase n=1 Tax=Simiduia sp. 21SJ11W-1 TaxID=2909669 RepID=UPI00209F9625|nr:bifunctional hydroxymethylpyrimidine kinase/phosphomethylpyrimidine kinase [Simiduia sp. 21SJ11W-1]UTA47490.1 bifunctional hydroxymethylpyrimidine kinase/phosphomethylpyrimidine kinase [Simiduia sp. 21SJ11W-1]
MESVQTPVILSFSPHDPTGCSGTSADTETAVSLGCHAATVITALTARDTRELKDLHPVDPALLIEQARALLEDMPIGAVKIGELASVDHCETIHSILLDYPGLPVVLDASAQAASLHRPGIMQALQTLLFPQAHIITAHHQDLQHLAPAGDTTDAKVQLLLDSGCQALLLTGCREGRQSQGARLYRAHCDVQPFANPTTSGRLEAIMGANTTLSAALAAYLAHGCAMEQAAKQALQFTWQSIEFARRVGMGKLVPNRLFWATQEASQRRYKH